MKFIDTIKEIELDNNGKIVRIKGGLFRAGDLDREPDFYL